MSISPPDPSDIRHAQVTASVACVVAVLLIGVIVLASRLQAPMGCYPEPLDAVTASIAATAACIGGSFAFYLAWRGHNWVHVISGLGCAIFVIGLVGGRASAGSQTAAMALACPVPVGTGTTAWSDTVAIGAFHISPIMLAGSLVLVVGICLALLFERLGGETREPRPHGLLADDDTV